MKSRIIIREMFLPKKNEKRNFIEKNVNYLEENIDTHSKK